MTRRHIAFPCEGDTCIGTLDSARGPVGLLIVTGGNETRAGAFGSQARLASAIAAAGYPVFRFDRRGVGDSTGSNHGFRSCGPDMDAALTAFRDSSPGLRRVVGFGNCDAASALMLRGGTGCDALALANPWTFDEEADGDAMTPAAVRSRYAAKLRDPAQLLRLVTGRVALGKLARGVATAIGPAQASTSLSEDMLGAMASFTGEARYLIAGKDRTGLAFAERWRSTGERISTEPDADHGFSSEGSFAWLVNQLIDILDKQTRQLDVR